MEIKLRQRIIGVVVLVALAIIFLPLLFKGAANDGSNDTKPITMSAEIPPAPAKPAAAAQTIVMIQNKDLNTPAKENPKVNAPIPAASVAANAATINSAPAPITSATPPAVPVATTKPMDTSTTPVVNSTNTSATVANTNDDKTLPTPAAKSVVNKQQTAMINNVEDAALIPATAEHKNKTQTTAKNTNKTTNHLTTAKTENKHLAANNKSTSTTTKKNSLTSSEPTSKKHETLAHTTKTTSSISSKTNTITDKKAVGTSNITTENKVSTTVPVGTAWEVRLGSFANTANVKDLVAQLRSHGFKAYTQSVNTNLGSLTRVVIGPEVKREKATAIQQRLAKELNMKSEVVPFSPIENNS